MIIPVYRYVSYLAGVWGVSEVVLMLLRRAAPGSSHDRNSLRLIWIGNGIGIFGAMYAFRKFPALAMPGLLTVLLIALVLFLAGIAIRLYSIIYLGKFFTANVAIAADHKLIDTGPYKFVRHPAYTGSLLTFLGFGLFFCNWASLAIMVVPVYAAFLWRIHIEEQALLGAFGEQYKVYMNKTKRLVPGVY